MTLLLRTGLNLMRRLRVGLVTLLVAALAPSAPTSVDLRVSGTIAILDDGVDEAPARHGLATLRAALAARGFRVADDAKNTRVDFVVVAGIGRNSKAARMLNDS